MEIVIAASRRARLLGLAFRREPPAGWALLLPRCRSVHTVGMRFPIDVVFLDRWGWPVEIRRAVPPRRLVYARRAAAVLELKTGDAERYFVARD